MILAMAGLRLKTALKLQDFRQEEKVGQDSAKMGGGVQVVDELRSDGRLREHESNGCLRSPGVAVYHRSERVVRFRRCYFTPTSELSDRVAETRERRVALAQELANLAARSAPFFGRKSLCGVRQHELVRFFDGVAPRGKPRPPIVTRGR